MNTGDGQGLLDCHRRCFAAGDFSECAQYFSIPLGVYTQSNGIFIYTDPADYVADLTDRCVALKSRGVTQIRGATAAQDLQIKEQYRLWVDWTYTFDDGKEDHGSSSIFYCKQVAGSLKVLMIQRVMVTIDHPLRGSSLLRRTEDAPATAP